MKHSLKVLALGAMLASAAQAQAELPLQDFSAQSLAHIEAERDGEAFLLVLWSVHCAPCFAELEQLGKLLRADPALPVELVSTDAPALRRDVEATLERYGLDTHASWQFAEEMPEKLRFHIDPAWYGELPRSYFYDSSRQRRSYSGALTHEQLQDWQRTRKAALGSSALHH